MILAHINGKFSDKETLYKHHKLTFEYGKKYLPYIEKIIKQIFSDNDAEFLYNAAKDTFLMHDEGKKSPFFQWLVLKNEEFKKFKKGDSKHSIISAILYLTKWTYLLIDDYENSKIKNPEQVEKMLWYFAFVISRHHSQLKNFSYSEFKESIDLYIYDDLAESYFINCDYSLEKIRDIFEGQPSFESNTSDIKIYILCRLLYSAICYSDFIATSEYMSGIKVDDKNNFNEIHNKYKNSFIGKLPYQSSDIEINNIRSKIFLEAENSYLENYKNQIFYLSAPCGAGKTNTLLNLMLKSIENENKQRGVFVFPLNTLIDQTGSVFDTFLEYGEDYMIKNSVTSVVKDIEDEEKIDYENIWLRYQFIRYPLVITSHVALFNILFGTKKSDCMCLCQLLNSTIAIDEVQQYNSGIWNEMIEMFDNYSKMLDIKFILSSATLPKLGSLLETDKCKELLQEDYSQYEIFKDRVSYDYSLFNSNNILSDIESIIYDNSGKSILLEFITKKTAVLFYKQIKDKFENVELMTGDDNKSKRQDIIKRSKKEKLILVATSVIEAGCDIDFEIGFKDISMIENDEQFTGRIARNGKYKGKVYFFDIDDNAFFHDRRTSYDLHKNEDLKKCFEEKKFSVYYEQIIEDLKKSKNKHTDSSIKVFKEKSSKLLFEDISDWMRLIKTKTILIYLLNCDKAKEIFDEFKSLMNSDISYSQKSVKRMFFIEKMNEYMLNVSPEIFRNNYKEEGVFNGIHIVYPYEEDLFL